MKIKSEHLEIMKDAISVILERNPNIIEIYESGLFARADRVKDLQTRFNWDLYWASGINKTVCDEWGYLRSDHISTALKNICPRVTRCY